MFIRGSFGNVQASNVFPRIHRRDETQGMYPANRHGIGQLVMTSSADKASDERQLSCGSPLSARSFPPSRIRLQVVRGGRVQDGGDVPYFSGSHSSVPYLFSYWIFIMEAYHK